MRAKKSYGQHFLHDDDVCRKIADAILALTDIDVLIEVGPGQGAITRYLVESNLPFFVIEADRDMVSYLKKNLPSLPKDHIIEADFLKVDLTELFPGQQLAIVGNFPYNISSQIVIRAIDLKDQVKHLLGMFQKEMADRVLSGPGSKTYGSLSVQSGACYNGRSVLNVGPGAFNPPPKVKSTVIALTRKSVPLEVSNFKRFRQVVRAAFNQRRKMLRNSLKPLIVDATVLENEIFTKRPEQLSVQDFVDIANRLTT